MVTATVTTAQELSTEQKKKITAAIEKKYGKVELKQVVDESIIGGVNVQVGSTEYDATVRGKLAQLRQELMEQIA
jgi:F-type H+-transporting ATPase subunit delta